MLFIVATPIGNLEDVTLRALKILREVDFILAEDTRKAGRLIKAHNLPKKRFLSFYEHNERERIEGIITLLKQGKNIALISNAGTPLISDPGYKLVRRCLEEKIPLTSSPGPCAVINSLVLSGIPPDKFIFWGFLSKKSAQRKNQLRELKMFKVTLIFFESPYRLYSLLKDVDEILGDKEVAVVREMTKVFEEVKKGRCQSLLEYFKDKKVKGEITVVVDNR